MSPSNTVKANHVLIRLSLGGALAPKLPCHLCGDAIVALPLPHLCWSGTIIPSPLPLPCQCYCHICTTAAITGLSPCHCCQRMSLASGAFLLAVLANAGANVVIVSALGFNDADAIVVCPLVPCLMLCSTTMLLPEDRQLLDANFDQLTWGPTSDKLEWLAEMDSACGMTDHVSKGSCHALQLCYCSGPQPWMRTEYEDVLVDCDGSIEWQRRRKW
jgi:hypothetical protein